MDRRRYGGPRKTVHRAGLGVVRVPARERSRSAVKRSRPEQWRAWLPGKKKRNFCGRGADYISRVHSGDQKRED